MKLDPDRLAHVGRKLDADLARAQRFVGKHVVCRRLGLYGVATSARRPYAQERIARVCVKWTHKYRMRFGPIIEHVRYTELEIAE